MSWSANLLRHGGWALAASALVIGGSATQAQLPDRIALGADSDGAGCTGNRDFRAPDLSGAFDVAYAITCDGVAASRPSARVSVVSAKARIAEPDGDCGGATPITVAGVAGEVRRCNDRALGGSAVVVTFVRGGKAYRGAAEGQVAGPMTRALAALVAGREAKAGTDTATPIEVAALAAAPAVNASLSAPDEPSFDTQIALRQGIALNWQGLYVEASRVLNDAISRAPASTPVAAQIELQLEAALADSNIRFTDDANDHFARAEKLLASTPSLDRAALLERKRSTYRALDALNRRDWQAAVDSLAANRQTPTDAAGVLQDLAILADLNKPAQDSSASAAVAASNSAQLEQLVVDAQRSWAASVAFLSRGDAAGEDSGGKALESATQSVQTLLASRVDPASIAWLTAQIERQSARLDIRRAERTNTLAAAYPIALGHFDCALAALTGQRPASEQSCAVKLSIGARGRLVTGARISGPVIAETQIERASLSARAGAPESEVLASYNAAVEALIATGRAGSLAPAGLENYLDLLATANARDPASPAAEQFFRAIQAVGEPAIARQLAQLQSAVSAGDPTISKLLREREVLKRDIIGLGFQIADTANDPAAKGTPEQQRNAADQLATREAERASKEKRLGAINDTLLANKSLGAIDDAPVTIADLQKTLAPGEVYFKVTEVRAHTYGMVIGKQQVQLYTISAASPRQLYEISGIVRKSIRDTSGEAKKIPFFNVAASSALFRLLAGPAAEQLLAAKSVVVDPGGPLANLPASVLVTDEASVEAFKTSRKAAPNDYSKVAFFARHADLGTALSPRSFIDARGETASAASQPFIGFGEHAAPPEGADTAAAQVGLSCLFDRERLAALLRNNPPISAAKLMIAATALGVPGAPEMTGAAFTDTAIEARTDLDQFKVLHFATHGLPETPIGCATVPPSLVTSIGDASSDGFLSFSEISALKLDANLVVLSACDTAASASQQTGRRSGQEESGRSLDGLVRAFLAARARAVMATYWPVSIEQESDQLMKTFYTEGRTASIGDSLRVAQTELITQPRYSHPYYWGAYFVVGDSSKAMLGGEAKAVASR